jgi:coenzyme F420-reducing hydrogenase beta subunit
MKSPVIAKIVEHDLCIGCGVCAAICPQGVLKMEWNRYGEYNPVEVMQCTKECGLCLNACPFADYDKNEDTIGKELYGKVSGISHRPGIGYYLTSFVGYSEMHRMASASGGMATWLLESLLNEGVIDHVICVAPTGDPEKLFVFRVFDTPEGLRTGAGSAYYPVEMSGVIRHILEHPGRYAVTGLPCFIKAIRLAQQSSAKLRERIIVCAGLVCGQLKSRYFTDYIAALAEVQKRVTAVRYRGKSPDHPSNNYHYAFTTADGERRKIFWNNGIAEAWGSRWFTPNACNYCDDIFAECADVTFMDAWLPEYSSDYKGTNLVLVRSPLVQEIIQNGINSRQLSLKLIPIQEIVRSQDGVIQDKNIHISYRLYRARKQGLQAPIKRVPPMCLAFHPVLRKEIELKEEMRVTSRNFWINQYSREFSDRNTFRKMLVPYLTRLNQYYQISRFVVLPINAFYAIPRRLRSYLNG